MTMTYSDPDYEITGSEGIIWASDVKERIDRIKPWHVENRDCISVASFRDKSEAQAFIDEFPEDGKTLSLEEYEDEAAELEALEGLLKDFTYGAATPENGFAVHEDYMTEYAEEEGDNVGGVGEEHFLFSYVDWKQLGKDLKSDMYSTGFRGSAYYIRS